MAEKDQGKKGRGGGNNVCFQRETKCADRPNIQRISTLKLVQDVSCTDGIFTSKSDNYFVIFPKLYYITRDDSLTFLEIKIPL